MTEKLEHVKRIFDFGYCPIVYTEQNKECEIIWQSAKQKTEQKYPDFTAHSWRIGENEKPVLVYSLDNYHDSIIYFWNQLKESAGDKWEYLKQYFAELSSEEVAELNVMQL